MATLGDLYVWKLIECILMRMQWLLWKSAEEAAGSASLLPALYTGRPLSIAKSSDYLESIFKEV